MTTAQMIGNGLISFDKVKEIVNHMISDGVDQIFPFEEQGKFYNEVIEEMVIDEEGNVFIQLVNSEDPVMLPHLVEVAEY
jgi:hypothetical protein